VKIRGYRAELQEIEGILRHAARSEQVAAVAWPISHGSAEGIVAFIAGAIALDVESVLERCRTALPEYMVPRRIYQLEEMPLNPNGKMDRQKLLRKLEENSL
jgi:D-alanine--poly(phosphoribitol) ligase subunit 1